MTTEPGKRTSIILSPTLLAKLDKAVQEHGLSQSEIIRCGLALYLSQLEKSD